MTHAFLNHLVGEEVTKTIRGIVEASVRKADDDEFADFHGLSWAINYHVRIRDTLLCCVKVKSRRITCERSR